MWLSALFRSERLSTHRANEGSLNESTVWEWCGLDGDFDATGPSYLIRPPLPKLLDFLQEIIPIPVEDFHAAE